MCKNGNERFISTIALLNLLFTVIALLLLVAPPVFMLLFLSGMAVTISEVSQKQNSKLWLDSHRGSCTLSVGIHLLQPSQSTQLVDMKGDEGWSALPWKIGLWIWPEVLTFYLKLSSHPQRTPQNVSHSLHMVQPGHQTSEGLLAPGLNSAGCLQMAFSKTRGRLRLQHGFWVGRKEMEWNCTAILVHWLETMNKLSFWRCCCISQR